MLSNALSVLIAAPGAAMLPQDELSVTTIGEFFDAGGTLMWPILLCSVIVLGLAIERYYSLRRSHVVPKDPAENTTWRPTKRPADFLDPGLRVSTR